MLSLRLFVCLVLLLGLVASTVVKHDFEPDRPQHRIRHRHEYYKHIREYLRRRRERLRDQGMKVRVSNKGEHVEAKSDPAPTTPVVETTATPSNNRKSIQKLKHYFYPKDLINRKIDEIRKTEARLEEVTTTSQPETTSRPEVTSGPEVHKLPDPDVVLRGLGKNDDEIEIFHHSKNSDFLHHHLTRNTSSRLPEKSSKIPEKEIKVAKVTEQPAIESIEKLEKEFRYDDQSALPILDRPLYEVPPPEQSEFKPVKLPSGFRHYDIDKDGFVSKDELVLITGAEENVDYVFKMTDTDGDELLSRREFHHAPWRLQGDPKRNSKVDKIRSDLESELAQKARKLHLDYIPKVTIGAAPSRGENGELKQLDRVAPIQSVKDDGRHSDPLGLWYGDDGSKS